MSYRQQAGKNVVLHLKAELPPFHRLRRKNASRANYANIYVGLSAQWAKKLEKEAEKRKITESEVLREVLDKYFAYIEKNGFSKKVCTKFSVGKGLKTKSRTVRRDQESRLRKMTEKSGRHISELVREALNGFLTL